MPDSLHRGERTLKRNRLGTVALGVKMQPIDLLVTVSPASRIDHKSSKVGLSPGIVFGFAAVGRAPLDVLAMVSGSGRAPLLALTAGTQCVGTVGHQTQYEGEAVRQAGVLG